MTDDLRTQLRQDPLVQDLAERVRCCGQPRRFFESIDGGPCPIFVGSVRRAYRQQGGTITAPAEVIATIVTQLAFDPPPKPSLHTRLRRFLRLSR